MALLPLSFAEFQQFQQYRDFLATIQGDSTQASAMTTALSEEYSSTLDIADMPLPATSPEVSDCPPPPTTSSLPSLIPPAPLVYSCRRAASPIPSSSSVTPSSDYGNLDLPASRKFDGKVFRQLLPGEYTQMAGRAGRRGIDKIGTVVIMCRDEIPEESDLKRVIVGSATRLESQFRLTYIMILHLLRVEELKVEDMLKRSFAEFHAQKKLPEQQQLLMRKLAQSTITIECIKGEPTIEEYYEMYSEAENYSNQISEAIMQSSSHQTFLSPGRVVVVKSKSASYWSPPRREEAPCLKVEEFGGREESWTARENCFLEAISDKGWWRCTWVLGGGGGGGEGEVGSELLRMAFWRKPVFLDWWSLVVYCLKAFLFLQQPLEEDDQGHRHAQDHLLGVIVKAPSANAKRYVALVLTPNLPSTLQAPLPSGSRQDRTSDFQILVPKAKRGLDDDYYSSASSRKGSGVINIKLPHCGSAAGINYEVREIDSGEILSMCNCKMKIDIVGLLEDNKAAAYSKTVQQLLNLKSDGKYPPALDPVKDLKMKDMNLVEDYYKWNSLLQKMAQNKCHGCVRVEEHIKLAKGIKEHKDEVNVLKFQMSDEALKQMPDFQGRIDVLKEIGCVDSDLVVQIKGRVACEMNSGEELICTECLFDNQLDDLEPEEAVAIMSALVFQQKNTSKPSFTSKLSQAKQRLYETALRLGELQAHFKLQINPEEYAQNNLKFGLVEVVYEWAKGTPFADICELTDVPEGLIVRTIVRLDETCREFKNAASIMGNSALYKKMESASNAIKRDIVFAASLYITGV
ncbi:RNA helicase, ATP-dependent, SK12/DOB1 protein [Actinidia rufa]|uniref:RNA helicase, ATP-dependent, SK12/DOB1 protein n=1 Tax=Actinidia rufa TaxID=165716 RepID=A0A7J0FSX0_9ERIC|nr:RNA helicase, ATP-dependent, SK12/DOB1 protein [Actinidia rufa]